jgi:thiamine transporter ThiT
VSQIANPELPLRAIWAVFCLLWAGGFIAFNLWFGGLEPTGDDAHHYPQIQFAANVFLVISMVVSVVVLAILAHVIGKRLRSSASGSSRVPAS